MRSLRPRIYTEPVKPVIGIRERKTLGRWKGAGMGRLEYQSKSSILQASRAGEYCRPSVLITRAKVRVSAGNRDSTGEDRDRDWEMQSQVEISHL